MGINRPTPAPPTGVIFQLRNLNVQLLFSIIRLIMFPDRCMAVRVDRFLDGFDYLASKGIHQSLFLSISNSILSERKSPDNIDMSYDLWM